jgi:cohesin complex subunit SCC1
MDQFDVAVDFGSTADDNDDRDALTTTSKWHKNTLKVYEVLQRNLSAAGGEQHTATEEEEEGTTVKPAQVSYNALSEGVSRRTAAGFFFELLQLKTLDYIELNQTEAYGDIVIAAGPKFTENPPVSQ